jgi:hypothetical protein
VSARVRATSPVGPDPASLRRLIDRDGGFTLDLRTGRPARRGISVAASRSISWAFPCHQWSDAEVGDWLQSVAGHPSRRRRHLGGWLDNASGTIWLDLVWVVSPVLSPLARVAGRAFGQHCVFDLSRGQIVPLRDRDRRQ